MLTCTICSNILSCPFYQCTICIPKIRLCYKCYNEHISNILNHSSFCESLNENLEFYPLIEHNTNHPFLKVSSKFDEDNYCESSSDFEIDSNEEVDVESRGTKLSGRTSLTPESAEIPQSPVIMNYLQGPSQPKRPRKGFKKVKLAEAQFVKEKNEKSSKTTTTTIQPSQKSIINTIFANKDAPSLFSSNLEPLSSELQFLHHIKKNSARPEIIDQFIQKYPEAFCLTTTDCRKASKYLRKRKMIDIEEIEDLSEPITITKGNAMYKSDISYPIPEYILDQTDNLERWSAALTDVGYLTKTGDFSSTDCLNDAEEHLAAITNSSMVPSSREIKSQTTEEITLRDFMIDSYIIYQRERLRQKAIIKDHGLTGLKLSHKNFSPTNPEDRIYNSLASICSKDELENFKTLVNYEAKIRGKIQKLKKLQRQGLKTEVDRKIYEALGAEEKLRKIKKYVT